MENVYRRQKLCIGPMDRNGLRQWGEAPKNLPLRDRKDS